jgi:hypothetical protein
VASVALERHGSRGSQAIVVRDRRTGARRAIYRVRESYRRIPAGEPGPIVLLRWSGDGNWIFFAIVPQGSNSIAADGLMIQVVSAHGGPPHRLATALAYRDYLAWCGGRLVLTAGANRLATTNKRLLVASPPNWKARPLVRSTQRAWGSVACAPDGRSVVVQSQPESTDYNFSHTRWALWRISLDGSQRKLTSPPARNAE